MSISRARVAAILFLTFVLVAAPATGSIGGIATTGDATTSTTVDTFDVTDNVSVWERAPLPFRLNTDDAAKTITNGAIDVEYTPDNTGPISIRKSETAVYQTGPVAASLDSVTGAGTGDFAGKNAQVIVARLEPNVSSADAPDTIPTTLDEAEGLLDPEQANENATFTVTDVGSISSTGELDTSVSLDQPGAYTIFLATGSAFSASNGDLSVDGDTTIIGMDAAFVEESAATVTEQPQTVEPGDNATFTVDAPSGSNVSVALYDTSTWTNSETVIRIEERINTSLSADNITIEHSIDEVNGVVSIDGSTTVMGTTISDAQMTGVVTAGEALDFLLNEARNQTDETVDEPDTVVIGDGDRLDASVVGKNDVTGETTIEVQTFENWTEGDYTWIVTTAGNGTDEFQTATGTLSLEAPTDDDDDDDPSPPPVTTPPDDEDDEPTEEPPVETPQVGGAAPGSSVEKRGATVNVNLTGASAGATVSVEVPVNDSEVEEAGSAVNGMNLTFSENSSGSINVSTTSTPTAPPVSQSGDLGYFEITHTVPEGDVSSATYTFTVSQSRVEQRGLTPDDVALYRYEDDGWRELETRLLGNTSNGYRYEADSPGLSLYAISQRNSAQANVQVTDASVSPTEVTVGDSVEVTATIENQGSAAGDFTAVLDIDGQQVDSETVRVAAGEQTTVTFTHTFDGEPDDYTVSVSGTVAGTVSVSPQETTTTTTQTTTTTPPTTTTAVTTTPDDEGQDGFNFGLILVAVLIIAAVIAAVVYRQRMQQ